MDSLAWCDGLPPMSIFLWNKEAWVNGKVTRRIWSSFEQFPWWACQTIANTTQQRQCTACSVAAVLCSDWSHQGRAKSSISQWRWWSPGCTKPCQLSNHLISCHIVSWLTLLLSKLLWRLQKMPLEEPLMLTCSTLLPLYLTIMWKGKFFLL